MNNQFPILLSKLVEDFLAETTNTYPPINIIKVNEDSKFRLEIGAIGFKKEEISIELDPQTNTLKVSAKKDKDEEEVTEEQYIRRKLSMRNFELKKGVPDYTEITNASLEDGLLTIDLEIQKPKEKEVKKFTL